MNVNVEFVVNNIADWIKAGVVAVSAGSSLTAGAKTGDYDAVAAMAEQINTSIEDYNLLNS